MNPILASLLNIGSRGIPQFIKGRFQTGGATPGGFRTNPFRAPRRRPGQDVPMGKYPVKGMPGAKPIRSIPGPPKPMLDRGGYLYRHPTQALLGASGLVGYGGLKGYDLLSGDDKPDEKTTGPSLADIMRKREQAESDALAEKQPSMSASHRSAYLKKRKKRLQKGMKQLLNQYMIIAAVAPEEADNFLKAGMKMMETDQEFNDDLQIQDAYDTVFQPGNMPSSGRDAFAKLLPYVGQKDAMAIAGDWSDLVPEYKEYNYMTKQRIEMRDIMRLAKDGYREEAIAALIQAWVSNSIAKPDNLKMGGVDEKTWLEEAGRQIDMSLGAGGVGGGDEEGFIKGIVG